MDWALFPGLSVGGSRQWAASPRVSWGLGFKFLSHYIPAIPLGLGSPGQTEVGGGGGGESGEQTQASTWKEGEAWQPSPTHVTEGEQDEEAPALGLACRLQAIQRSQ